VCRGWSSTGRKGGGEELALRREKYTSTLGKRVQREAYGVVSGRDMLRGREHVIQKGTRNMLADGTRPSLTLHWLAFVAFGRWEIPSVGRLCYRLTQPVMPPVCITKYLAMAKQSVSQPRFHEP
jgi:hypothetical protein